MKLRTYIRGLRAVVNSQAPMLAQLIVTRRCNLTCGYCNEYDTFSPPVPTDEVRRWVDHLASLGTVIVTWLGGEPLLHPDLDKLTAHVVSHNMVCTAVTNGLLLNRDWIERLNDSGLHLMQISVDNLAPNETSQKSLRLLEKKLPLLKQHARFDVNINAVLGSCPTQETRELARKVREMGFYMTINLLHNEHGMLERGLLEQEELEDLYAEMDGERRRSFLHRLGEGWERQMLSTGRSDWKCRAGSRYLYVDEFGVVSYCSQRRGAPGIPLLEYGSKQIRHQGALRKGCEPGCTISCVRRVSVVDGFRRQEAEAPVLACPPSVSPQLEPS